MKFKHGLAFPDADEYLIERLPESGVWQSDALNAGLDACRSFRTALDGGAHVGTWSIQLAQRFQRVMAFEPAEDTYQALLRNVPESVETKNIALGRALGWCSMEWSEKDQGRKHTGARYIRPVGSIPVVTIDSLQLDDLDFLKLDLEGAEPDALMGAEKTLKRCRPVVVFEDKHFKGRFGHKKGASAEYLASLGAHEYAVCGINKVWRWK